MRSNLILYLVISLLASVMTPLGSSTVGGLMPGPMVRIGPAYSAVGLGDPTVQVVVEEAIDPAEGGRLTVREAMQGGALVIPATPTATGVVTDTGTPMPRGSPSPTHGAALPTATPTKSVITPSTPGAAIVLPGTPTGAVSPSAPVKVIQTPTVERVAPVFTPTITPSPPPSAPLIPSPTPLATLLVSARRGSAGWLMVIGLSASLAVAILVALILRPKWGDIGE